MMADISGVNRNSILDRLGDGWIVGITLSSLAYGGYVLGFLSIGKSCFDAFSIAFGHVLPATLLGTMAWYLQPSVRKHSPSKRLALHALLAGGFGFFWASGLAVITWFFAPEVLPRLIDSVLSFTAISGILVYAFLASIYTVIAFRKLVLELDATAAHAELSALRSRIEPHFLYNALESISGVIRSNPDAAEDAVARLGQALRRLLDGRVNSEGRKSDHLVSLAEELAFVRDTLFVEKLRMGERLRLVENIDSRTLDLAVPTLTIQPLVENAIQHGLSNKPEGGTLSIVSRLDNGNLVLEVSDDGVGADEQSMENSKGLGLDHLRRRLLSHFGERANVNIAASPALGVSIQIVLPAVEV